MAWLIYLFEDDDGLRSVLTELLAEELDARVITCQSFAELAARAQAERPDLIVADFWGASHLTLADGERQQIEQVAGTAPTLLVSARRWAQETSSQALGLAGLLTKPIDLDAFMSQARAVLHASAGEPASNPAAPETDSILLINPPQG